MYIDYYKLLHLSPQATREDIKNALEQMRGTYQYQTLEEMRMVLLNPSLKLIYDKEYNVQKTKDDNSIINLEFATEIKKIKAYIHRTNKKTRINIPKPQKNKYYTWIVAIVAIIFLSVLNGVFSYYRGRQIEENAQKFERGDYNYGYSTNNYDTQYSPAENNITEDKYILDANKLSPYEIGEGYTITDVEVVKKNIMIRVKVNEDLYNIDLLNEHEDELRSFLIQHTISDKNQQEIRELLRTKDYGITYYVFGSISFLAIQIEVPNEEIVF